jgi:predicted nucleotidyltransferase
MEEKSIAAHKERGCARVIAVVFCLRGSAVDSPIGRNLEEIASLCRRYGVRRLAAFGSILRADFDPVNSDADFLVEFEAAPAMERMKNYFALREALGALLSRPVDLVEDGAIRNPYILRNVAEHQQVLYAA